MMVRCAHDALRYSEDSWEKKSKLGSLQQFVRASVAVKIWGARVSRSKMCIRLPSLT